MSASTASGRPDRAELVGGWLLSVALIATSFGVVWDVQWYDDVGPDTFFTAPHMLIYAAPTLAGLTGVVVVLMRTGVWRADPDSVAATGRSVTVLGVFRAPIGFLVAGIGAAVELIYGMIDLWWHTVYGFDVTLNSPPHVGLSLGGLTICVGAVLAFTALGDRAVGRWGLVLSVATSLTSIMFALFWAQPFEVSMTAVALFALLMVAGVTRATGWVTFTGLLFGALHPIDWFFAPWITRIYAGSQGMSLRDNISGEPTLASLYPMVLPLSAVLVEVTLVVPAPWTDPEDRRSRGQRGRRPGDGAALHPAVGQRLLAAHDRAGDGPRHGRRSAGLVRGDRPAQAGSGCGRPVPGFGGARPGARVRAAAPDGGVSMRGHTARPGGRTRNLRRSLAAVLLAVLAVAVTAPAASAADSGAPAVVPSERLRAGP
ncbi:hypothetical protein QFZ55_007291 [Streptomyces luteogriseus]|uniref:hypothetical protein n=1 Tax=Streptomyces luteogriseus TaxID=68233 RepID=UPI00277E9E2E|nr:hypothetical protein [Streptomyces luteogriseus]MDQ0717839.1 hypothetical protein [Streptomyces luteogriseus]